jgi:AraC-like DNA-binding protein
MEPSSQLRLVENMRSTVGVLREIQNAEVDDNLIDSAIFRLEGLSNHMLRFCSLNMIIDDHIEQLIRGTASMLRRCRELETVSSGFKIDKELSDARGRPRFLIGRDQLQHLLNYGICVREIADAIGVSESTIFRRMKEYGLSVRANMTFLTDSELDSEVREVQCAFPNAGYRRVLSQLIVKGIRVTELKVRETMQRLDPQGVALRWIQLIPRRRYSVSGPLALWHIDGHHKLIR